MGMLFSDCDKVGINQALKQNDWKLLYSTVRKSLSEELKAEKRHEFQKGFSMS